MGLLGNRNRRSNKALEAQLGGTEPPAFPALTLRILDKLRDPDVEFDELAESIRWDAGLTVKLLGTVNSAAYAPRRPVEDVKHAITLLGRAQLESVVLGLAASTAVRAKPLRGLDPARFWRTAAERATLARLLATRLHPDTERESFTAGLLLDLALPIMAKAFGDEYSDVLEEWHATPGASLHELEQVKLGRNHASIGGMLASSWELPTYLTNAIAHHHGNVGGPLVPAANDAQPAIHLVAGWRETAGEPSVEALVERARADFGLEPDWTLESIETARADADGLATILCG